MANIVREASIDRERAGHILVGAVCGLAWGAGFRGFMREFAGSDSNVEWLGTFVWILLPAIVVGGLLGWADHIRRTGGRRGWRWLALSPLMLWGYSGSQTTTRKEQARADILGWHR